MNPSAPAHPPEIHLLADECEQLSQLALDAAERHPVTSELLLAELDRAQLHDAASLPDATVTMHSRVEFVDEGTGASRSVELVYPHEADIAAGRISILTPIGAGLIGLRAGSSIRWPDRAGHERTLRIVSVRGAAEPAPVAAGR